MASPSMEIPAIHGWNMPLVVENRDEMYGRIHGRSCHPWMFLPSMDRMGLPMECIISTSPFHQQASQQYLSHHHHVQVLSVATAPALLEYTWLDTLNSHVVDLNGGGRELCPPGTSRVSTAFIYPFSATAGRA